jgi:broad specificity phosphatase PhoE
MTHGSQPKSLWLIRHGPTHAKTFVGWTDLPADLSDTARLARMDAALPDVPVVSSTLDRARKTADAIQGKRTRLPHDARLMETHFGDWENLSWAEIEARDSALARRVFETPGDIAPPKGESWNDFSHRVHAGMDALTGDTIVVAHMGVILAALQRALGCTAYEALGHTIDPLSITHISYTIEHGWSAGDINQNL